MTKAPCRRRRAATLTLQGGQEGGQEDQSTGSLTCAVCTGPVPLTPQRTGQQSVLQVTNLQGRKVLRSSAARKHCRHCRDANWTAIGARCLEPGEADCAVCFAQVAQQRDAHTCSAIGAPGVITRIICGLELRKCALFARSAATMAEEQPERCVPGVYLQGGCRGCGRPARGAWLGGLGRHAR